MKELSIPNPLFFESSETILAPANSIAVPGHLLESSGATLRGSVPNGVYSSVELSPLLEMCLPSFRKSLHTDVKNVFGKQLQPQEHVWQISFRVAQCGFRLVASLCFERSRHVQLDRSLICYPAESYLNIFEDR